MMHTIIGFPCGTCGWDGPIPRVRHDDEYTLGCLISFGSEGPKPDMQPFLLRVEAYQQHTNLIEWGLPC